MKFVVYDRTAPDTLDLLGEFDTADAAAAFGNNLKPQVDYCGQLQIQIEGWERH
jgi:hypothetical protein